MLPGDDIYEEIDRGIRLWDKVLLCCSKDALTSWWVDSEINAAFEKERRLMRERGTKVLALIPLDLDGALFNSTSAGAKSVEIRSRHAADFTRWGSSEEAFSDAVNRLLPALRTNRLSREPPPQRIL
jgi:hypothetical protein